MRFVYELVDGCKIVTSSNMPVVEWRNRIRSSYIGIWRSSASHVMIKRALGCRYFLDLKMVNLEIVFPGPLSWRVKSGAVDGWSDSDFNGQEEQY